jgi:protein-disulfide isomerase-like protein with CxxC motif
MFSDALMRESNHHGVVTRTTVDFWMDPLCPWSYLTAEWLIEVQRHAPVDIAWGVMSLAILNEGNEIPEEWRRLVEESWGPVRALVAARQAAGPESYVPLLQGIARRWHVEERRDLHDIVREAVAECGLPESIAEAAWDPALDAEVRREHDVAMALGGSDVGSPILAFDGPDGRVGYMGPIVSQVPRGAAAVDVFEAVRTLAFTPGVYEVKRTRDVSPQFA